MESFMYHLIIVLAGIFLMSTGVFGMFRQELTLGATTVTGVPAVMFGLMLCILAVLLLIIGLAQWVVVPPTPDVPPALILWMK